MKALNSFGKIGDLLAIMGSKTEGFALSLLFSNVNTHSKAAV
jgi:hypothetical protein